MKVVGRRRSYTRVVGREDDHGRAARDDDLEILSEKTERAGFLFLLPSLRWRCRGYCYCCRQEQKDARSRRPRQQSAV
jgi:hypothetical protein